MPRKPASKETIEVAPSANGVGDEARQASIINGVAVSEFPDEQYAANADAFTFDEPGTVADAPTGSIPGKRRGRPPGSSTKTRTTKTVKVSSPVDTSKLAELVCSGHAMVAAATGFWELEITDEESRDLVKVSAELSAFYNYTPNPLVVAWIMFLVVIGKVYGTRAVAIKNRMDEEKKSTKKSSEKVPENPAPTPIR